MKKTEDTMNNSELFRITTTRKNIAPLHTDTENHGEICEVAIEANTRIMDLFLEYVDNFDKHIARRLNLRIKHE